MDHTEVKQQVPPVHKKTPQGNHSGGALVRKHGSEGSTTSTDDKDERWRDGWDDRREQRVLRKMDIHLLPFVSLLYLLSFL